MKNLTYRHEEERRDTDAAGDDALDHEQPSPAGEAINAIHVKQTVSKE